MATNNSNGTAEKIETRLFINGKVSSCFDRAQTWD